MIDDKTQVIGENQILVINVLLSIANIHESIMHSAC